MTGHYVYRYMHPDYPWLYVGKTDSDLTVRIATHQNSNSDNISREFLPLLNESAIYYVKLENSLQTTYVEKLLIDKYKPFLNKMDKIEDSVCPIEIGSLKWKKFDVEFKPKVIVKEKPCEKIVERVVTIEKPVYREMTALEQKEFSRFKFYYDECMDWRDEFSSIRETGSIPSLYNEETYRKLFQPDAFDFINYYKRENKDNRKKLHFVGNAHDCFGNTIYFKFDGERASISYSSEEYAKEIKSAYVTSSDFKEIIHTMQILGGVYGTSKRDYELFLEYYKGRKERAKLREASESAIEKCNEKIKKLEETIAIINSGVFCMTNS